MRFLLQFDREPWLTRLPAGDQDSISNNGDVEQVSLNYSLHSTRVQIGTSQKKGGPDGACPTWDLERHLSSHHDSSLGQ